MNTLSKVQKAFGYRLIGNKQSKKMVVKTLMFFPENIILYVTKKCWIVSSFNDGWGFTLKQSDIKKGEYLIFLSDALFSEDKNQIFHTIAHEIGHVILGHRNAIGIHQSKDAIKKQENEADKFAEFYLK